MKFHYLKVTKKQLDAAIPEAERNLLILSAHAANELGVLTKLVHFCAKREAASDVEKEACNAQAMALGRLLTGKLYECWNLLRSAFFSTRLSETYEPQFDDDAKTALAALKKYFGKENLIEAVRNRHAFHYAPDQIARGYTKLAESEALNIYMSQTNANTLYAFADVIARYSVVEDISPDNPAQVFDALIVETPRVLGWLNQVIAACMAIAIQSYVGENLDALGSSEIELSDAPDWKAITIPYFVEIVETEVT